MGNCKDCKHWGKLFDKVCDRAEQIQPNPDTEFWIDTWAADDTSLGANLVTAPLFGCVHFVSKENTNET